MTVPVSPDRPRVTAPLDWAPPAKVLPRPYDNIRLKGRLGRNPFTEVWSATVPEVPNACLIVAFHWTAFPSSRSATPEPGRFFLQLDQGWPPTAIVTWLPATLPVPFSRFRLLRFLGVGGMGEVWKADSPDYPESPLAIKFFTHPDYQDPLLFEESLKEARLGLRINHPAIVRVFQCLDLGQKRTDGWPPLALVMPLHKPTLADVLGDLGRTGQRLPQDLAVSFARDIADGLRTLHQSYQLVHRDVKPTNILLRLAPDRRCYDGPESLAGASALLGDLGTACPIGERPLSALAQDGWKAPELFGRKQGGGEGAEVNGARPVNPAEDLFGFGKVLLALAEVVDGSAERFRQEAMELTDPMPEHRPAAHFVLRTGLASECFWERFVTRTYHAFASVGREGLAMAFRIYHLAATNAGLEVSALSNPALLLLTLTCPEDNPLRRRVDEERTRRRPIWLSKRGACQEIWETVLAAAPHRDTELLMLWERGGTEDRSAAFEILVRQLTPPLMLFLGRFLETDVREQRATAIRAIVQTLESHSSVSGSESDLSTQLYVHVLSMLPAESPSHSPPVSAWSLDLPREERRFLNCASRHLQRSERVLVYLALYAELDVPQISRVRSAQTPCEQDANTAARLETCWTKVLLNWN